MDKKKKYVYNHGKKHMDGTNTMEIVEIIREQILKGELKPGQRLREMQMAKELNTSRTPIREAFRILQAEGLLEHKPNCSVTVAEGLDAERIGELMQVWGILLAEAAYEACKWATDEEKTKLLEIQKRMEKEEFEPRKMSFLDYDLHNLTAKMSRNVILEEQILGISARLKQVVYATQFRKERFQCSIVEHRHIVNAIVDGNMEIARLYTKIHFYESVIHNRDNVLDFNRFLKR